MLEETTICPAYHGLCMHTQVALWAVQKWCNRGREVHADVVLEQIVYYGYQYGQYFLITE